MEAQDIGLGQKVKDESSKAKGQSRGCIGRIGQPFRRDPPAGDGMMRRGDLDAIVKNLPLPASVFLWLKTYAWRTLTTPSKPSH